MQSFDQVRHALAENVRIARAKSRLSQEALADAASLERSQISLIERELANPSLATLCQLADALEMPLPQLLARG